MLKGGSLLEAARFYAARHLLEVPDKSVEDVVTEMLAAKREEGLSKRYLQDLESRASRFAQAWTSDAAGRPESATEARLVLDRLCASIVCATSILLDAIKGIVSELTDGGRTGAGVGQHDRVVVVVVEEGVDPASAVVQGQNPTAGVVFDAFRVAVWLLLSLQAVQGSVGARYADCLAVLAQRPTQRPLTPKAAGPLHRWARAEREAWLAAASADPLLPRPLLPAGYRGEAAWQQRQQILAQAARLIRE